MERWTLLAVGVASGLTWMVVAVRRPSIRSRLLGVALVSSLPSIAYAVRPMWGLVALLVAGMISLVWAGILAARQTGPGKKGSQR
jgi:hypothetical protein